MTPSQSNWLIFIWTFLLLNLRPSVIAQSYNPVVFMLFIITSVFVVFWNQRKITMAFSKKELLLAVMLFLTVLYFFVQGIYLSNATKTVINSSIVLLGGLPCLFFVLREFDNRNLVVKSLINIHVWLSLSQIVTFLIFIFSGFKLSDSLVFLDLHEIVKYYNGEHELVFPYTITWSSIVFMGIEFYRTCGIYREPGMAQIFYLTAFYLTFFYSGQRIGIKRGIILIGSILLFSGSGFINILLGYLVYLITNRNNTTGISVNRLVKGLVIVFTGVVFLFFTYDVLMVKISRESGVERLANIEKSILKLADNPFFGEGTYNSFKTDVAGKVVSEQFFSFFGVVNQIGLIGIFLYMSSWFIGIRYFANVKTWCLYVPCFVTLISSQPSYNDMFTFFMIILNTANFYPASELRKQC